MYPSHHHLLPALAVLACVLTVAAKIPLEIHIMSQCPDAQGCFSELIYPALPSISALVDFRMTFIGTPTSTGVSCKHGPSECLGNALHLCAAALSRPPTPPPPLRYIGFSKCLLDNYSQVSNGSFVRECARGNGVDFDRLVECAAEEGVEMLRQSAVRSQRAGVSTSCTVRVEDRVWCIRDGGEWKECEHGHRVKDLVKYVKGLAGEHGELRKRKEGRSLYEKVMEGRIRWRRV